MIISINQAEKPFAKKYAKDIKEVEIKINKAIKNEYIPDPFNSGIEISLGQKDLCHYVRRELKKRAKKAGWKLVFCDNHLNLVSYFTIRICAL